MPDAPHCDSPTPCPAPAPETSTAPARRLEVGGFLGLDYFGSDIELGNSWASEQIPGTSFLLGARAGFIALPDLAPNSSLDPQLGLEVETKLALGSTGSSETTRRHAHSHTQCWQTMRVSGATIGTLNCTTG